MSAISNLLQLMLSVVLFCIGAYGLWWCSTKFQLPRPLVWLFGVLLCVLILLWLINHVVGLPLVWR